MKKFLFLILLVFCTINITSQIKKSNKILNRSPEGYIRCYSTEYENNLQKNNNKRVSTNVFEDWISNKISKQKLINYRLSAIRTIPVVVHVINKGEAVGTGTNISDAQVISQITTLNNDYRKKIGTKGYNTNPVGADANIEFALAVRDPNGNPTNGIDRISFNKDSWDEFSIENELKPNTIWDPTKYLNLWVVNFGGDLNGYLGYAQFPEASTLSGLNYPPFTANTDGVIIGYKFFGNLDYNDGSFNLNTTYGYGRTATHEVGHWLGLRHIWGDSDCGTDYVADTPTHKTENYGCFTHPKANTCTPPTADEMFENYMDYTNDACMNIFTINQVDRFNAVLANSPRRKELLTSDALTPVALVSNDAEVEVQLIYNTDCSFPKKAQIRLINRGNNTLTSAIISVNDAGVVYNQSWSGSLATNSETFIPISLNGTSTSNNISVTINSVNSSTDNRVSNNTNTLVYAATQSFTATQVLLELQLDIFGSETSWKLIDGLGNSLYTSETYQNSNPTTPAVKNYTFNLANNTCYYFKIYDSAGDGICCNYGSGYYKLTTSTGTIMTNSTFSSSEASYAFVLGNILGIKETNKLITEIFPNPTNDVLNVTKVSNNANFTIYNISGQFISKGKVTNNKVDVAALVKGVYFIEVSEKGATSKLKFIKK
ncbi:M43 family zinc metalloprotease [Cloacibacterium sp. TD35]|uniref:M43 family zinc metalloprotease n=1 Tax=Cloacibacterium sp. TD35 TaxID=2976818 RepID=UPI00237E995C|nr:M43 family zinc metalloprotease [Cloacibacterium sp. TD35]WDT68232.1 M43 family zinc metalloprotease [Cloacibacterium sp. TD35]